MCVIALFSCLYVGEVPEAMLQELSNKMPPLMKLLRGNNCVPSPSLTLHSHAIATDSFPELLNRTEGLGLGLKVHKMQAEYDRTLSIHTTTTTTKDIVMKHTGTYYQGFFGFGSKWICCQNKRQDADGCKPCHVNIVNCYFFTYD